MFKSKRNKNTSKTIPQRLITSINPKSVVSEQFRTLRTNINYSMPDKDIKTLLITSATPSEGKSTSSSNTAVVFAQEGKKVLLVDGDMRKPTVHRTFGISNTTGLSSLLSRQKELNEVIQSTHIQGLSVISSGPIPPYPAELLASQTMDTLIKTLSEQFDLIIFDSPPVLSVTDSQIISNKCDGTILIINAGEAEKSNVLKAKEVLLASKAKILGAVLNNYELNRDHDYYQYYGEDK